MHYDNITIICRHLLRNIVKKQGCTERDFGKDGRETKPIDATGGPDFSSFDYNQTIILATAYKLH